MKPLYLDYQRKRPASLLGIVLLVAGIAAAAVSVTTYAGLARELADRQARLEQLGNLPQRAMKREGGASEALTQQVSAARETVVRLTVPWNALFDAVENADSKSVALLALAPDSAKQVVKIAAEAKDFGAMLDYVRQLEADPVLYNVSLASHEIVQQDPEKPVRFNLSANWSRTR